MLRLDRTVRGVLELGLPGEALDKFLYANASRVYKLDPRPAAPAASGAVTVAGG